MIDRNQLIEMLKECPYMRLARPGITFYQVADWLKARLDPPAVERARSVETDGPDIEDSPNATPEGLTELRARGFKRINDPRSVERDETLIEKALEWYTNAVHGKPISPDAAEHFRAGYRAALSRSVPGRTKIVKFRKKAVVVDAWQWHGHADTEGLIVRYYRRPDDPGTRECEHCGKTMHDHGWLDTLESGHVVCPGDWIITGIAGEQYPCKPDVFDATYEPTGSVPGDTET